MQQPSFLVQFRVTSRNLNQEEMLSSPVQANGVLWYEFMPISLDCPESSSELGSTDLSMTWQCSPVVSRTLSRYSTLLMQGAVRKVQITKLEVLTLVSPKFSHQWLIFL